MAPITPKRYDSCTSDRCEGKKLKGEENAGGNYGVAYDNHRESHGRPPDTHMTHYLWPPSYSKTKAETVVPYRASLALNKEHARHPSFCGTNTPILIKHRERLRLSRLRNFYVSVDALVTRSQVVD
jgi:hypothetical protein